MTNETVGITAATAASPARLRADAIQRATLIQLGRMLAEGDANAVALYDALEDLGRLAGSDRRDGELDAALDDVATYAALDAAVMDLSPADARQLFEQAARALPVTAAVTPSTGTVVEFPQQHDGRWTA